MNRLLILDSDASIYHKAITAHGLPELEIALAVTPGQAQPHLSATRIILGTPALVAEVVAGAKRLQWVQSTYAGVEQLCRNGLRQDYLLTGIKGLFGTFMREYVFAYILGRERSLVETHRNQQQRRWSRISYRSLAGLTIGIAGLGSIGRDIAETARHFDMRVLGMKRTPGTVAGAERCFVPAEMDAFLPLLDYLVLVLPDTESSRNFISHKELKLMKPEAVLINVGRGSSVNQKDLVEALAGQQIGGAVLDVFEQEPLPQKSPLWSMDQVLITPHNAAYSFPDQVAEIFCANYRRFLAGTPLDHVVDFSRGY